jgi:polysaccharide export outer membrane protein
VLAFLLLAGCAGDGVRTPSDAPIAGKPRPAAAAPAAPTNAVRPFLPPPRVETSSVRVPSPAAAPESPPPAVTTVVERAGAYRMRTGDPVIVFLRGIPPQDAEIQDVIDDAGYINLPYLENILASGKTTFQLEAEIQRQYIEQQIYRSITVNVVMPSQSYFVRGEVRAPGRFAMVTGITLVQAIASAGGFTDFADRTDVKVIRGEKTTRYNARDLERHPERDIAIEPGDVIVIERSIF